MACRSILTRSFYPVTIRRDVDHKPCTFAFCSGFCDSHTCYSEDFPADVQPYPRILPGIILKYVSFLICRNPDTIILQNEIEPFTGLMICAGEVLNFDSMPDRVFGKVDEDILKERICINLESFRPEPGRNRSGYKGRFFEFKYLLDTQPGRRGDSKIFI